PDLADTGRAGHPAPPARGAQRGTAHRRTGTDATGPGSDTAGRAPHAHPIRNSIPGSRRASRGDLVMTTTHTCASCGMPIETGRYCEHCTDENGQLQSFDQRFERMTAWQA